MLTKSDFQAAAYATIEQYPDVAPLYHAGDPMVIQRIDAMASMLALYAAQQEVAMAEPFAKTRDATVLADAAMRGIVPKATPVRVRVRAANRGTGAFAVESGRVVLDSAGMTYRIETSASIPAGGEATFEAVQLRTTVLSHTVTGSVPFYAVEIPAADDGAYLCAIAVADSAGDYAYRDHYVNIGLGDRVFHVEADDRQRIYVRFGMDGVVGTQPVDGLVLSLSLSYSFGAVTPAFASPFAFEYLSTPFDYDIDLKMDTLLTPGANPHPMAVLRDLARYPSTYDYNAVYLGEFDFLVRRQFTTLRFLSVWNERVEEEARGANLENINALFVAVLSVAATETILTEPDPLSPVSPTFIADVDLTATQQAIRAAILAADDGYRVRFVTPVRSEIPIVISATVSAAYVASDVRQQIIDALLAEFGEVAAAARRGKNRPLYQRVYALLKASVAALSGPGADMIVSISEPDVVTVRPEMWRYVSAESLSVTVLTQATNPSSW